MPPYILEPVKRPDRLLQARVKLSVSLWSWVGLEDTGLSCKECTLAAMVKQYLVDKGSRSVT